MNLYSFSLKKSHCSSKPEMLIYKNLVFRPLLRFFNTSQFSEMQFKTISNEFGKFILHSCRIWTLHNTLTVLETHKCEQHKTHLEHINTYLFFIYFVDVVNRNRVSGGNQIKWNCLKRSKPVNYVNLQVFIFNSVFTF